MVGHVRAHRATWANSTRAWQRLSARVLRAWRGERGNWCPGYQAVAAYLAAEQQLGRVRDDVDPREAAAVLLGALFALAGLPGIADAGLDPDRVASAVRLLVRGIQPPQPER